MTTPIRARAKFRRTIAPEPIRVIHCRRGSLSSLRSCSHRSVRAHSPSPTASTSRSRKRALPSRPSSVFPSKRLRPVRTTRLASRSHLTRRASETRQSKASATQWTTRRTRATPLSSAALVHRCRARSWSRARSTNKRMRRHRRSCAWSAPLSTPQSQSPPPTERSQASRQPSTRKKARSCCEQR